MKTLTLIFFAEFALLALAAPLAGLRRSVKGQLAQALLPPLILTILLVVLVRLGVWSMAGATVTLILELQALALGFALAVTGAGMVLSRRWPRGGPLVVTVLALALLASPFWGDALLNLPLGREAVAGPILETIVTPNPLFTICDLTQYDWMHSSVLYGRLSRLGEDFMPPSGNWLSLATAYAGLGLLLALAAWRFGRRGRVRAGTHQSASRSTAGLL
jgi:hypothetical protein